MTIEATVSIDRAVLDRSIDAAVRVLLGEASIAVRGNTRRLEKDLEALTRFAVRGRLWRAWRSESYPRQGPAREPQGQIFINGGKRSRGAMTYFTTAGRVTKASDGWLAIPTAAAGSTGRARELTPRQWELRTGLALRYIKPRGANPMLVLDNATISRSRGVGAVRVGARRRAAGRKSETIVIFNLVPYFDKQNRFSVEPLVRRRESIMAREFETAAITALNRLSARLAG